MNVLQMARESKAMTPGDVRFVVFARFFEQDHEYESTDANECDAICSALGSFFAPDDVLPECVIKARPANTKATGDR